MQCIFRTFMVNFYLQLPYSQFLNIISMKSSDKTVILKLKKITAISLLFMMIQLFGGYYAHSIAIFADAFHLLSDVLAYVISLFAVLMSYQQSPKGLTFGYEKMQPLGALLNVGIIWIVTVELFIEATGRIIHKQIVEEPTYMLFTSIFGLVCNLYILNILHTDEDAGGHHNCSHSHHKHAHEELSPKEEHNHHDHHQQHGHSHHEHGHGPSCHHDHHKQVVKHQHNDQCQGDHQHHHEHKQKEQDPFHSTPESSERQCCSHSNALASASSFMKDQIRIPSLASDEEMHSNSERFHNNINMEAAYIHILTDIILSIGVIISATIIYFFAPEGHIWSYWQIADPICTYLFSFLAIYSTMPIIKESLLLLLDGCSTPEVIAEIENELNKNPNVKKIQSLRVWSTNRGKTYGALKVKTKIGGNLEIKSIFSTRKIEGYVHLQEQQEFATLQ